MLPPSARGMLDDSQATEAASQESDWDDDTVLPSADALGLRPVAPKVLARGGDEDWGGPAVTVPPKRCSTCKALCTVLVSRSQENPGRFYFVCPCLPVGGFAGWVSDHLKRLAETVFSPTRLCGACGARCVVRASTRWWNMGRKYHACPNLCGMLGFVMWLKDTDIRCLYTSEEEAKEGEEQEALEEQRLKEKIGVIMADEKRERKFSASLEQLVAVLAKDMHVPDEAAPAPTPKSKPAPATPSRSAARAQADVEHSTPRKALTSEKRSGDEESGSEAKKSKRSS